MLFLLNDFVFGHFDNCSNQNVNGRYMWNLQNMFFKTGSMSVIMSNVGRQL